MLQAIKALSEKFDTLQQEVEILKTGSPRETPAIQGTPAQTRTWGERAESPGSEDQVDCGVDLNWSDDQSSKLTELSDETNALVTTAFTQSVDNATRQQARSRFILPSAVALKTPRLDDVLKAEASPTAKSLDKELAKVQTFMLDASGPLAQVLEEAQQGQLTLEGAVEAAETALRLLGNANARTSRLRRHKVLEEFNKTLQPLADKDDEFKDAAPALFGTDFARRAKEHLDQVKTLRSAKKDPPDDRRQPFRGGPSGNRGKFFGQGHFRGPRRGGAPYRYQPYRNPSLPRAASANSRTQSK